MRTKGSAMHKWRTRATRLFGATAFVVVTGGFIQPAVSQAREWDIDTYDRCVNVNGAGATELCCKASGGDWNKAAKKCEAPPANAQTNPQGPTLPPVVVDGGTIYTRPGKAQT
jgi:hypothetical protein